MDKEFVAAGEAGSGTGRIKLTAEGVSVPASSFSPVGSRPTPPGTPPVLIPWTAIERVQAKNVSLSWLRGMWRVDIKLKSSSLAELGLSKENNPATLYPGVRTGPYGGKQESQQVAQTINQWLEERR